MAEVSRAEWEAYRIIENMGLYDMFSAEAVRDSGLDKDTYMYIINHKTELHEQFDKGGTDE